MELKEAIFDAHRITEEIRNHAMKKELTGLWNCIIENIEPLRNALDVICKHYPEDRWTPTSDGMPNPNEYVQDVPRLPVNTPFLFHLHRDLTAIR